MKCIALAALVDPFKGMTLVGADVLDLKEVILGTRGKHQKRRAMAGLSPSNRLFFGACELVHIPIISHKLEASGRALLSLRNQRANRSPFGQLFSHLMKGVPNAS
jgi:hypothetical protein